MKFRTANCQSTVPINKLGFVENGEKCRWQTRGERALEQNRCKQTKDKDVSEALKIHINSLAQRVQRKKMCRPNAQSEFNGVSTQVLRLIGPKLLSFWRMLENAGTVLKVQNAHCIPSLAGNFHEPETQSDAKDSGKHHTADRRPRTQKSSRDLRQRRARQRQLTELLCPIHRYGFQFVQAHELCSTRVEGVGSTFLKALTKLSTLV